VAERDAIPPIDPTQIAINYIAPGSMGVPNSTGNDPSDKLSPEYPFNIFMGLHLNV